MYADAAKMIASNIRSHSSDHDAVLLKRFEELVKWMRNDAKAIEGAAGESLKGELLGIVGQLRRDADQMAAVIEEMKR